MNQSRDLIATRINYRTADLLESDVQGFTPSEWQPYPLHCGKRLSVPAADPAASFGYTDVVAVTDGLHAIITDWPAESLHTSGKWGEMVPEQYAYLYIALDGDGCLEIEGLGNARRSGPWSSITFAPPDSTFVWKTIPGVGRRGLTIPFHARYLRRRYPDVLKHCSSILGPWLANAETQLRDIEIALSPLILAATAALLSTTLEGYARHTFVSTTAEQMLCLAIASLATVHSGSSRLSTRDRQTIRRARARLHQNFAEPPKVEELARELGINRTKLRCGFRELFGATLEDYLRDQRMRAAYELLEQGDRSVGEIAAGVGYPHLANFATAFRKRFGRSPSAVRGRPVSARARETTRRGLKA